MDKKNIVIADFNEEYLEALEFEFVKNLEQSVDIHIITDEKYFNEYFGVPQKIDILIIDEALVNETIIKQNISKIFVLSESEEKVSDVNIGNKRIYHLYRYDNVKENYHKVMGQTDLAVHNTAGSVKNTPKTNVITVYSPVGGSGVTVTALGICCAMKKLGKRVLYMDTNTLQNFDCYFMNKEAIKHGIGKDIASRDELFVSKMHECIGNEIFEYMKPFKPSTIANGIGVESLSFLTETMTGMNKYDYIIIDTSTDFDELKLRLISNSQRVVIVTMQDRISVWKTEQFINNIEVSKNNKFYFVCNKFSPDRENKIAVGSKLSEIEKLEYVKSLEEFRYDFDLSYLYNNNPFEKSAYSLL